MTTCRKRTDHRPMDGHDPKCANLRALPPDTLSDTHRCRHFLSSREPSVWLTGTRESIKEPDGAGVLIPPAPSPPAMSKLNAHGVQKQVPTPNTFIRSHTPPQVSDAQSFLSHFGFHRLIQLHRCDTVRDGSMFIVRQIQILGQI